MYSAHKRFTIQLINTYGRKSFITIVVVLFFSIELTARLCPTWVKCSLDNRPCKKFGFGQSQLFVKTEYRSGLSN